MRFNSSSLACLVLATASVAASGCHINLPSNTHSNVWARSVEDRADWHLSKLGYGKNPTHVRREMTDWTKGFYQGYYAGAATINQLPQANYPAVWAANRREMFVDDEQRAAGYQAGYSQAMSDGFINVAMQAN